MKYLIFVLAMLITVSTYAQEEILVKTDGTKYYFQLYDGETNEKVLQFKDAPGWQYKLFTADYFDGSQNQLFSFKATEMYPGYFSVVNHAPEIDLDHHLMSYSWYAYFDPNRNPVDDKEMQFKFVEVVDGWYKLETIEKPTDGSLYGINYTPGPDALNVDENGRADFGDVKSDDITPENMVNKVFKLVEFDPLALFLSAIERSQELYEANPNVPAAPRYDLFYAMEKARETRLFGTDSEMLAFQPKLDSAVNNFIEAIELFEVVSDARLFIEGSGAGSDVKASFMAIVDEVELNLNSEDVDYASFEAYKAIVLGAKDLVNAIVAAEIHNTTLEGFEDQRLSSGMLLTIDGGKSVLADLGSDLEAYRNAISLLQKKTELIDVIIATKELIEATQEFEEAKAALNAAIEVAIGVINTEGTSVTVLDEALEDLQDAIKAFQRALEAGDTLIELKNADFEKDLANWNVESPTPNAAYLENKGVDGSRSITFWNGAAYQMKFFQSISNIPNGTYIISCFADVSSDGAIALFAESGDNSAMLPMVQEGGLTKRVIELEVTNGMLQFGIKGAGEDNAIPAGNWVVFDEFEVKLSSFQVVPNGDFEDDLTGWLVEGDIAAAYPENKGVDGSRSITCWSGADYTISVSQTMSGLANGSYVVSAMAMTSLDGAFVVFGESAGVVSSTPVTGGQLAKTEVVVGVTDGTLKIGLKGAGEGNAVSAGTWTVFDNFEVKRMPDLVIQNSGFEDDFNGWTVDATPEGAAYLEAKGVDGSKSVTCWSGSDYNVKISQTLSGLSNGTYKVSAMAHSNSDGSFVVFGQSGTEEGREDVLNTGTLSLTYAILQVNDGTLEFGIKGGGENSSVAAGNWIVFDNFEVKIDAIVPDYVAVNSAPQLRVPTHIVSEDENKVVIWQNAGYLHIRSSSTAIVKCSIYDVRGILVETSEEFSHFLSIPLNQGIFIVKVFKEDGSLDIKKIIIQ
jgi:tetratricopeptide (TPR) repeat protein